MIFEDENPTKINYPIGGFAPGHYFNKCRICEKQYTGDKHSLQCEPCAINSINESHQLLYAKNKKMEEFLREIQPRFKTELFKPEFDKIEELIRI